MPITQAIIPAAGYGTRLRPLTLALPKEMLPLGRKPVLEHVLDEIHAAGITKLLFVVSPNKDLIPEYFGDGARWGVTCEYVQQTEMRGLGDALLLCQNWTEGRPALVAFGDCVMESDGAAATKRLISCYAQNRADAAVLTQRISPDRTSRYGIMKPGSDANTDRPFRIEDIVEKPEPKDAPSNMAVAGRWVIGPPVFDLLRSTPPAANGELNLTDAIRNGLRQGLEVWAAPLMQGEARRDIGGWETYLTAVADYAARDEEFGPAVRRAQRA
jgi:UTP--glucose-1-phosphate uridylyltransferase